ncbi:glycosyltransferase family 2 protein [Clostridium tyrobutyricum]|uniref:glycosyltransferase family 2 protein n=1 Tax=Clostridium tyrobutyricum TaxID=1519 RepID=UPI0018AADE02|nr:glycosyltransferase family 2 protein [Clostridium tyrobutyricum]
MAKYENLTVSIVIPCRNEKNYIGKCIDSFLNQSYDSKLYEILVCDGMSDDGTRSIVKNYEERFNNVKLIDNLGLSAPKGMNAGIKYSKSDIIIIFGAHAYSDYKFIQENINAITTHNVGCVGGPIETINKDDKGCAISMAMSSPFGVGNALFRYAKKETYVDTVAFGCYRKETLDKIGYFDEELVRNQDDELNFRIIKNGYKILLSPKIKSYYYSRSSLKKLWKQYYQYGFWKVRIMQKHGGIASIRHLIPAIFVLTNLFGIVLGVFHKSILYLWILEIILYIIGDIIFSLKLIKLNKNIWKYIFGIFPILHISYGIGFINGLLNCYIFKSKNITKNNTKISR